MLFNRMFVQNDIMEAAMQGVVCRNEVIQNNIANVDTPNFKKGTVAFENALSEAIEVAKKTGKLDLKKASPVIKTVNKNFNYRIDKNNVDIELEMVDLYKNSVSYDALVSGVMNNYKRLSVALSK